MRIYKTTFKSTTGKVKKCKTFYIEFLDHTGAPRRLAGDKDRDIALDYGRQIEAIVRLRKLNQDLGPDLCRWIDKTAPKKIIERLRAWDIISDNSTAGNKLLSEYLTEYKNKLRLGFRPKLKSGCTEGHVDKTHNRVKRIIDDCHFTRWQDIDLEKVHEFLSGLDISEKTYNYYARDFGQFVRWMMESGRANTQPRGKIPRLKVEKKRVRRPLTADELTGLVASLPGKEKEHGLSGTDRAVLYILAAETGFRAGELQRLQVYNFDLKKGVVTLEKEKTKNRESAEIPLKKSRVKQFQQYLAGRDPESYVFPLWQNARGCEMIQADMEAAKIAVVDDTGLEVKFHSLRDTFITSLNQTDAKMPEIRKLARHSMNSDLTFGTYTLITDGRLKEIIEQLPSYGWPGEQVKVIEKTA